MSVAKTERKIESCVEIVLSGCIDCVLQPPPVKEVLSDFEAALWSAVEEVFPNANHTGCCIHFKQAILRMAKKLGLGTHYLRKDDNRVRATIERVMCLSILPADRIPDVFHYIREKAPVDAVGLKPFLNYVDR